MIRYMVRRLSPQLLWVLAGALVLITLDLGGRIFSSNDEARFALLAREVMRGEWFFPRLNGVVYHNKPLLLAWLIALVSWPVGAVTQLTAVLPSAAATLATALIVYALGREMFGADAGKFAALTAMTTQGVFVHARVPMPDMLMTAFITASLWMLWRMARGSRFAWLGFYGFIALAFWAKGPAGLLPLAVALAWAAASGTRGAWRALRLPFGVPLVVALVSPWGIIGVARSAAGVKQAVLNDQLLWYLPQSFRVAALIEPIQNAFGILFPCVFFVPLALTQAWRARSARAPERDALALLLVWLTVVFALVAVSYQQRLRYYLPLVPPATLLVGWWVETVVRRRGIGRMPWRLYAVAAAVLLAASLPALWLKREVLGELTLTWPAYAAQVGVLIATLASVAVVPRLAAPGRRFAHAFTVTWLGCAVLVASGYHVDLVRRNSAHDYPRLRERVGPLVARSPVVATWGLPDLPVSFYLDRPVVNVDSAAYFRRVASERPRAVAIVADRALATLGERDGYRILLRDHFGQRPISVVDFGWGAPKWPPIPPSARSAPAQP